MPFLTPIVRSPYFLTILLVSGFTVARGLAQADITGAWESEVRPGLVWGFHFSVKGNLVTGSVIQGVNETPIDRGAVSGRDVTFQVTVGDGNRVVTFRGVRSPGTSGQT